MFKLFLSVTILFTAMSVSCIFADTDALIITNNNNIITINKGSRDGIQQGQELHVKRGSANVGKIKITRTEDYYSEASPLGTEQGMSISAGDTAVRQQSPQSSAPSAPSPSAAAKAGSPHSSATPYTATPQSVSVKKPEALEEQTLSNKNEQPKPTGEEIEKQYAKTLGKYTKGVTFSKGNKGKVGINLWDTFFVLNAVSSPVAGYQSNWMLFDVGRRTLHGYSTTKQLSGPKQKITIGIIYYGDELIREQAGYYASRENIQDPAQQKAIEDGIKRQLGTDMSNVFQVKLSNEGKTVIQLAPFKWKMYLETEDGQKIKASRYDDGLDKGLGPGQEVEGYVYFPKNDEMGRPISGKIKIKLENILESKAEVTWQ